MTDTRTAARALHAARERHVRSARGPLALVTADDVTAPRAVWPVPGEWAPATGGLTVTATAEDGVVVDGVVVDGTVLVAGDDAVVPSVVTLPDGMEATVAAVRGGHALRVWDPMSEAVQRFGRIGAFPVRDEWVVAGTFLPAGPDEHATVADAAGDPLPVAGRVRLRVQEQDVEVVVVRAADLQGGARLQLVFQDATSAADPGEERSSYSMGRFLYLDDPRDAGPADDPADDPEDDPWTERAAGGAAVSGADGVAEAAAPHDGTAGLPVELDFNRAVLPPCAFSYHYACPIPPEENRLPFAVEAGETHGYDLDGAPLH